MAALTSVSQDRRKALRAAGPGAALLGRWRVRRRIYDFRAGTPATFEGVATVTAEAFEERGQLDLGHARLSANRTYRLRFDARGVAVDFSDGSPFIRLESEATQAVEHLCGRDTYVGRFFFLSVDHWAEAWRVSGPQKHYASVSRYERG